MIYKNIKEKFTLIHGPCSIESYEQMDEIVKNLNNISTYFRGGIYKPRTNPNSFQGLGKEGIEIIKKIKQSYNITMVCEITSIEQLENIDNIDIIQVGARNMQNFELLKSLSKINKPIILKRGFSNTIEELIGSANYLLEGGNDKIILCERGIRTFSNVSRFTLDLSAVGYLKDNYDFPVFIDPSHAGGNAEEVKRLTRAAYAYGCDGIIIEVHPNPLDAKSDNEQQLNIAQYKHLIETLNIKTKDVNDRSK